MKRVVVDPISRIEGHLRVEIKVDEASGKVEDALSSGTAGVASNLLQRTAILVTFGHLCNVFVAYVQQHMHWQRYVP